MKKFFTKLKNWWSKHKPSKRRLIQLYAALLYNANIKGFISGGIYKGATKNMCLPGLNCYSCPGAVGACPLGALQNALAASGTRAPFYVLGIIMLFGLILGRTVCGFLCPVGLGQELLYKIKSPKLKKSKFTRIFSYFKYVLLVGLVAIIPLMYSIVKFPVPAFCKYICPAGTFEGAIGLLVNPHNADLYAMLGPLFTWKFAVLCVLSVASVFIYRFFCRFFCPLGALYGLFSKIALLGVKLDKNKCTDCGLCIQHCKMDIKRVGDHECIHCGECIKVCPAHAISWKGSKLFVHANAEIAPPSEEKPLGAFLSNAAASETAEKGAESVMTVEVAPVEIAVSDASVEAAAVAPAKPKKTRAFWAQLVSWICALALLVSALVYYNFIDKDAERITSEVGDTCYDFTVKLYPEEEENFTLSDYRGKVVVVNFWATWCTPCVAEIPLFEKLQNSYADDVVVVAIQGVSYEPVAPFIKAKWDGYHILFAQDNLVDGKPETFPILGGRDTWPITLVVDREGVISYTRQGSITYEQLEGAVLAAMQGDK
ncbi:MAG: redoxin family protein [Clostridiales bacterium]|nr:redoxin family protein [Clostridiales bacterium]